MANCVACGRRDKFPLHYGKEDWCLDCWSKVCDYGMISGDLGWAIRMVKAEKHLGGLTIPDPPAEGAN